MKVWLLIVLFALAPLTLTAKEAAPLAADEATEQRLVAISSELRCLVCQNESLSGSHAELAGDHDLRLQLCRSQRGSLRFKLYRPLRDIPLSDALPMMGVWTSDGVVNDIGCFPVLSDELAACQSAEEVTAWFETAQMPAMPVENTMEPYPRSICVILASSAAVVGVPWRA